MSLLKKKGVQDDYLLNIQTYKKLMAVCHYNLAATWAAEFPDLLTQEKENLLKDSTKVLILLITLLIVQSEGKLEDTGSMHSLESLSKITWDHPSREAF